MCEDVPDNNEGDFTSVRYNQNVNLEKFFAGYDESRRIFERLQKTVVHLGPYKLRVTKSQVAFVRRKPFAWAWVPSKYLHGRCAPIVLTLSYSEKDSSPRFKEIIEPKPGRFIHHLELYSESEIDEDVNCWLVKAWEAAQ